MRKQVWAWECELCGHVWLANGIKAPAQCSRCKARSWHTVGAGEIETPDVPKTATASPLVKSTPAAKPTLADLRSLVAGIMETPAEELVNQVEPEIPLCGFESYNEVDGENYRCGLAVHGPKVKHGKWEKL